MLSKNGAGGCVCGLGGGESFFNEVDFIMAAGPGPCMHVDRVCRLEIRWAWILREGKVQPPTCAFLEKDGTDFLLLLYFCSTCCRVPSTGVARHPNLHMNQNQIAPFSRNLGLLIPPLTSRHDQPPIQSHSMLFNTLSPPVVEPPCHSKHKLSEHNLRLNLHLPPQATPPDAQLSPITPLPPSTTMTPSRPLPWYHEPTLHPPPSPSSSPPPPTTPPTPPPPALEPPPHTSPSNSSTTPRPASPPSLPETPRYSHTSYTPSPRTALPRTPRACCPLPPRRRR